MFNHHFTQMSGIPGARLGDPGILSAVVIAAAGAVGLSAYAPPEVRSGPRGTVVALLCHGGHIVLHSLPDEGICVVDIVAVDPAHAVKGADVIARRLGAESRV